jgi:oxygen-independent coproporphyrinogen-3 oxidase
MLSPSHLRKLFSTLHDHLDFSQLEEVTLEANPATFDLKKATLFRELGVTRVSLGIQSFTPHVLEILGREHSVEQASEAVSILRAAGIPSVNIDLMFSIPGQSKQDWEQTLHHAIALQPDHISAYNLTYEEDTAFFDSLRRGDMKVDEDQDAEYFHLADSLLTDAGFDHYETSNYAKSGHHSSHNRGYWMGEDYLGLGPSSVSTIARHRHRNLPDTNGYIRQVGSLGHAIHESEALDAEATRLERIALGLRTKEGIPLHLLDEDGQRHAAFLAEEGLAIITETRLVLVHRGRALVDPIAAELV